MLTKDIKHITKFNDMKSAMDSRPHTCPVCGGNGLVPNGFYNQTSGQWASYNTSLEQCRTCNGSGIVWQNLSK